MVKTRVIIKSHLGVVSETKTALGYVITNGAVLDPQLEAWTEGRYTIETITNTGSEMNLKLQITGEGLR